MAGDGIQFSSADDFVQMERVLNEAVASIGAVARALSGISGWSSDHGWEDAASRARAGLGSAQSRLQGASRQLTDLAQAVHSRIALAQAADEDMAASGSEGAPMSSAEGPRGTEIPQHPPQGQDFWSGVGGFFGGVAHGAGAVVGGAGHVVGGVGHAVADGVGGTVHAIGDAAGSEANALGDLGGGVLKAGGHLWDGVTSGDPGGGVGGAANSLLGGLGNATRDVLTGSDHVGRAMVGTAGNMVSDVADGVGLGHVVDPIVHNVVRAVDHWAIDDPAAIGTGITKVIQGSLEGLVQIGVWVYHSSPYAPQDYKIYVAQSDANAKAVLHLLTDKGAAASIVGQTLHTAFVKPIEDVLSGKPEQMGEGATNMVLSVLAVTKLAALAKVVGVAGASKIADAAQVGSFSEALGVGGRKAVEILKSAQPGHLRIGGMPDPEPIAPKLSPDDTASGGSDMAPGSPAHRQARWEQYQATGGTWSKEHWDNVYSANMKKPQLAREPQIAFMQTLDWGPGTEPEVNVQVTVNGTVYIRRLDIANMSFKRGYEVKTGDQAFRGPPEGPAGNQWEIARDKALIAQGWDIRWHFVEDSHASDPLLQALRDARIPYDGQYSWSL